MRRTGPPDAADNRLPKGQARKQQNTPSRQRRQERRALARLASQIDRTAHERHEAWLEGGRVNTTTRLTRELGELYDEHRDEQAGTLTDPYYGRTMKAGR